VAKTPTAVGYVRVSKLNGRDGDGFLSPELQRAEIEAAATRHGYKLVAILEEFDASGGDPTREQWNKALKMIETGKVRAMICLNLSRFSRSLKDATTTLERLERAGGVLVSAQEGIFDDSASGKLIRNTLFNLAEFERNRQRDSFRASVASAVDRGIAVTSRIPLGYVRNPETRKLVPDPETAPLIVEIFERRRAGQSWTRLARYLIEQGHKMSEPGIKNLVANPTYVGTIRSGDFLKPNAHPALVSKMAFDKANSVKGKRTVGDGSLHKVALLQGLVTCGSCRGKMYLSASNWKGGRSYHYYCRSLTCDGRAYARGPILDAEVEARVLDYLNRINPASLRVQSESDNAELGARLEEAQRVAEEAEYDLRVFAKDVKARRMIGDALWHEALGEYTTVVNVARAKVEEAKAVMTAEDEIPLSDAWDEWTFESRTEFLARVIRELIVAHGKGEVARRIRLRLNGAAGASRWILANGAWEPVDDKWSAITEWGDDLVTDALVIAATHTPTLRAMLTGKKQHGDPVVKLIKQELASRAETGWEPPRRASANL
jgi:site-specific DNA recombinase